MVSIKLENVSKTFGDHVVLDNINLEIEDGELFVLLGPSGSGKTTLLRIIAGLEEPNGGKIFIGDKIVNMKPPHERNVAMVFQTTVLYPHLTVRDNILFAFKKGVYAKQLSNEVYERYQEVVELLKIGDLLEKYPEMLSGGEKKRVALAKALIRKPKVILLDEPLSDLDVSLREELMLEITKIKRKLGVTMVYVTHDQSEAFSLGDRIGVLYLGKIVQVGSPRDILENPNNIMVAKFAGNPKLNLIECEIERKGESVNVNCGDIIKFSGKLKLDYNGFESLESKIIVGFPPSELYLTQGEESEIAMIEEKYHEVTYYVISSAGIIRVIQDTKNRWQVGDHIGLKVKAEEGSSTKFPVFDPKTGFNIGRLIVVDSP